MYHCYFEKFPWRITQQSVFLEHSIPLNIAITCDCFNEQCQCVNHFTNHVQIHLRSVSETCNFQPLIHKIYIRAEGEENLWFELLTKIMLKCNSYWTYRKTSPSYENWKHSHEGWPGLDGATLWLYRLLYNLFYIRFYIRASFQTLSNHVMLYTALGLLKASLPARNFSPDGLLRSRPLERWAEYSFTLTRIHSLWYSVITTENDGKVILPPPEQRRCTHTTRASGDTWYHRWRYFKQGIFIEVTTCAEAEKTGEGEVRKKSSAVVSRALSEDSQRLWLCFQLTVFLSVLSSKGITLFPQLSPPSLREAQLRVSWILLPLSTL